MNKLIFAAFIFASHLASADFQPFNHDVSCQTQYGSGLKIVYDKTEFPKYGWQGGIHVELNTGAEALETMASLMGISPPVGRILRREPAAGQVGNWIGQDPTDPMIV